MAIFATLTNWKIRRVGGCLTIDHSQGKVTNIKTVFPRAGEIIAVNFNGVEYMLDPA